MKIYIVTSEVKYPYDPGNVHHRIEGAYSTPELAEGAMEKIRAGEPYGEMELDYHMMLLDDIEEAVQDFNLTIIES